MADKPKYRHTVYFKNSDLENVAQSVWSPTLIDWRDIVEDYIEIAKKRKDNKLALFKLQIQLMGDIVLANDTIKKYIKLIKDPDYRKQEFPNIAIDDSNIKWWEQEVKSYKILLNALKDIGDGIAWRVLNYERSLIYNMCVNNEGSGPLTLNIGLITELHSMGDFANDSDIISFVYHGITNFLLISDLTTVHRNGDVTFIEVKSGNPRGKEWKERFEHQKERAENIANIGNKLKGESSKVITDFRLIDSKPQTFLDKVDTLLKRAENKDVITQIFNSYSGIGIVNLAIANIDVNFTEKFNKLIKQIKNNEDDIIVSPTSIDNYIFSPNRAPISVHPYTSCDIANILFGKYVITHFFNISQFFREIEKHGWKVENIVFEREKDDDLSMFSVHKDNLIIKVPPLLISRAMFEGLSVESIIRIFEYDLRRGPTEAEHVFYGFEKEKYLWV